MPNKDEVNILKAQQHANVLKRAELKKQGVDIDNLSKQRKEAYGERFFNPVHENEEKLEKEGDIEGLDASFKDFEVNNTLYINF